jgi:hypothetical protein
MVARPFIGSGRWPVGREGDGWRGGFLNPSVFGIEEGERRWEGAGLMWGRRGGDDEAWCAGGEERVGSWAEWAKRPGGLAKLVGQSQNRN